MGERLTGKRGFTLIELLVVIAIIAILAAILFPVFAKAKDSAKKVQCINNIKQVGIALQMYLGDNSAAFPVCNKAAAQSIGDKWGTMYSGQCMPDSTMQVNYVKKYSIWKQLDKYIKNRNVWVCPTKGGAAIPDIAIHARFTSYEYRQMMFVGFTPWSITEPALEITKNKILREGEFPSPSKTYSFREIAPFHDNRLSELTWMSGGSQGWHRDSQIIVHFIDGHVKSYAVNKVFSPESSKENTGWDLIWPRIGGFPSGYLGAKRDLD